ncbi:phosphoesterase [Legionella nautarum]|uniref:Phosphoesterase n=1 Tax=Legionella nautarum TaxID=45070 RepID=A0A0W0WWN7_9GAMM|nr:metallophosphoesterase [Legionella nautarum]KTD36750.1 phosphoesterase [Legionella nautarum]
MKIAWLTDIHLNFLDRNSRIRFYEFIVIAKVDLIIISGDIAEAPTVKEILIEMGKVINRPIYFVLGNHDYYFGYVQEVRDEMSQLDNTMPILHWLPATKPVLLKNQIYLVGQDGWADGRNGNYYQSPVAVNDSRLIVDLFLQQSSGKKSLLEQMQLFADSDAQQLNDKIIDAAALGAKQLLVITHVPPFKESCFHRGKTDSKDFFPYYSSQATGKVLLELAVKYEQIKFSVFCGHTHAKSLYKPLENLTIKTGQAEYYMPEIQEIISL